MHSSTRQNSTSITTFEYLTFSQCQCSVIPDLFFLDLPRQANMTADVVNLFCLELRDAAESPSTERRHARVGCGRRGAGKASQSRPYLPPYHGYIDPCGYFWPRRGSSNRDLSKREDADEFLGPSASHNETNRGCFPSTDGFDPASCLISVTDHSKHIFLIATHYSASYETSLLVEL